MSITRRFLVAPALVRLIRKERGGARITEGHFAPQGGRNSYVRVDGQTCQLVLANAGVEERTDVPRAHGDALLDVCPGKAAYDRTALSVSGREVAIDRYVTPGSLDLVSVAFDAQGDADGFSPPAWFGREVSGEPAYERSTLAIQGVPAAGEVSLSNAALDAVLDLIEPRFGFGRFGSPARAPEGDDGAAARRISMPAAAPTPAPVAAPIPAPAPEPAAPEPAPAEAEAAHVHAEPAPAEHAPEPAHEAHPPHEAQPAHAAEALQGDARIDDVIESLSQALGAAIQHPAEAPSEDKKDGKGDDPASMFERWTVRPRRTQQQS